MLNEKSKAILLAIAAILCISIGIGYGIIKALVVIKLFLAL